MLDERRSKLIDWLSAISYNLKHEKTSSLRQENTGNWILELEAYKSWEASKSDCLWLHGLPGSGKSVLVSNVIEHLQRGHGSEYTLAYCYCDFAVQAATLPQNILRTLLVQLIADLPSIALDNFKDLLDMQSRGQAPPSNLKTLKSLLIRACTSSSTGAVVMIIDALDECSDRDEFLICLTELAAEKQMRILVSSRTEPDIVETFVESEFTQIPLSGYHSHIHADMKLYISEELKTPKWRHVRGPIQQEITQSLLEGSEDNMYGIKLPVQ